MDLDELLRCLAEAESGELREELTGGSYVVVQYDPEGTYVDDADLAELFGAPAPGTRHPAPGRRLGGVATRLPGARFVMLASAAPPHQEVAFAILELPPRSTPDPAGRTLLRACAAGDVDALRTALDEGADVGTLDEYGATPLHHAVAARSAAAVDALLAAGADPRAQAAFGNAPQFTAAGPGRPHPTTRRVEGEELSADYLVELVDIMVTRGVRDRPGTYGRTGRQSAQNRTEWRDHAPAGLDGRGRGGPGPGAGACPRRRWRADRHLRGAAGRGDVRRRWLSRGRGGAGHLCPAARRPRR